MSFNSLWGVTWTAAWQMGQATRQVPLYLNSGGGSDGVTRFQLTAAWFPQREAGHGLSLPMLASCSAGNRSLPQAADRQPPGHRLILLLHPQPSANGEASSFQADLYGVSQLCSASKGAEKCCTRHAILWMTWAKRNWIFKGKQDRLFTRLLMAPACELGCPTGNNRTSNMPETSFFPTEIQNTQNAAYQPQVGYWHTATRQALTTGSHVML